MKQVRLIPHANVQQTARGLVAATSAPWLELVLPDGIPSGRWIRLAYRTSFLDHLVRPLIRFETAQGVEWDVMRAALFGRAVWIGRVPEKTTKILISPVDQPGLFGFEIEYCRPVKRLRLLRRALRTDHKTTAMALGARLINARQETRQALMFSRGGVPLAKYSRWRAGRSRPYDPAGLDAPRVNANAMPHIRVVLNGDEAGSGLDELPIVRSLLASSYERWSLCVVGSALFRASPPPNLRPRTIVLPKIATLALALEHLAPSDLVICVDPSDRMADYALPVVAETAARDVRAECFYADEDALTASGIPTAPRLKPDWSPRFEAEQPYLGRAVFWRARFLSGRLDATPACFDGPTWRRSALSACGDADVQHIRRVVMSGAAPPTANQLKLAPPAPGVDLPASVSIVIPTKNKLDLLQDCLDGILRQTNYASFEVIIVDHESDAPTLRFYKTLAHDPRIRIISVAGRFNFSAMCNAAASIASGECLVFLNNDVSIVEANWLSPLIENAMLPDIGAVGARLLFPSGRIQHAGVTVGMGGYADHTSHSTPAEDPGYLGRLRVAHEVSAVTGACIAVEARKFRAVGGFDAEHLPVELNDIDLCLKLHARGWKTLMCPNSVLIHHQSASRGFTYRPFTRYGQERKHFRLQWGHIIRDDPYFHPALSLFSVVPALDG